MIYSCWKTLFKAKKLNCSVSKANRTNTFSIYFGIHSCRKQIIRFFLFWIKIAPFLDKTNVDNKKIWYKLHNITDIDLYFLSINKHWFIKQSASAFCKWLSQYEYCMSSTSYKVYQPSNRTAIHASGNQACRIWGDFFDLCFEANFEII